MTKSDTLIPDGTGGFKPFRILLSSCMISVSVSVVLILGTVAFFQVQITSLQKDLAAIKKNLSAFTYYSGESYARSQFKRSSDEVEDLVRNGSGEVAALLQGSLPFQQIERNGRIGPWNLQAPSALINLRESGTEIEIVKEGTYFIYAQVYYLTTYQHNSYQIIAYNGTDDKNYKSVAICSAQGSKTIGEVSCFTGLARKFVSGERIYLNQIEQNRLINFTNGGTYVGIIFLEREKG